MHVMKKFCWVAALLFFCYGCGDRAREEALAAKEQDLIKREQALQIRADSLLLKETRLRQEAQRLDSSLRDTTIVYNPDLVGRWNAKMTCTETNCHGSAVGDSKTEVWDINYSRTRVIAKVMEGNKLSRIYTGSFAGNQLELMEDVSQTPGVTGTQIIVRLTLSDPKTMNGQREIVRSGDCRILYELQLKKQ